MFVCSANLLSFLIKCTNFVCADFFLFSAYSASMLMTNTFQPLTLGVTEKRDLVSRTVAGACLCWFSL